MLVSFDSLPDHARIWIYPSNRKFSEEEIAMVQERTAVFLTQWTAHGADLMAGFDLPYDRFLVIGLNQEQAAASGCSIDASVRFIQSIQEELGVDLLDKMNVTFYTGEHIAHKPLIEFKKMAKNKSVSRNTVVFNNLVNTKEEYQNHWEVPAYESWHNRFLP
jgi:hypothetical protein